MSDPSRQSMTDKASAAVKPDSQKSMLEQAGDKMKSTLDSGAASVQSDSQKSTSQRASDSITGNTGNEASMLDKAKNAVGMGNSNN